MDEVRLWLQEIGQFLGNDNVARGAVVTGGTALAVILGAWRLLRRKTTDRVKVSVDAPKGQSVKIELGEEEA